MAARHPTRTGTAGKGDDGGNGKGVGYCQFTDWIHNNLFLRAVFEQLSAIDKNQKNYAVIDRLGVSAQKQASLVRKELSTVFLIPLFFPIVLTSLLVVGTQFIFGEAILQEGLVLFNGVITILLFCAIYLTYFGATIFLFKKVILQPEIK